MKQIGIIGLGKMGAALALNMKDHGWEVHAYNRTYEKTLELEKDAHLSGGQGIVAHKTIEEMINSLQGPKLVWLMLTAGEPTQEAMFGDNGVINYLKEGDTVIEGGNSFFEDDKKNSAKFMEKGINYLDVGVSGGPYGARNGACLMIGGEQQNYKNFEELFKDISKPDAYRFFAGYGAGHFVKMAHNAIEYGMMQAIAEGMNYMKQSDYKLDLMKVAEIYNNGSVIESRLTKWMQAGFEKYGVDLKDISSEVKSLGEAHWTVLDAKKKNIPVKAIEDSVIFRDQSKDNPSYVGKVLSMLRNMFGGHSIN